MPPHLSDEQSTLMASGASSESLQDPKVLELRRQEDSSSDVAVPPFCLLDIIQSEDEFIRHYSLMEWCRHASVGTLLQQTKELHEFAMKPQKNLYEKVRALFFLYAIHRFQFTKTDETLQTEKSSSPSNDLPATGKIPYQGYQFLLERQFTEAISIFYTEFRASPNRALSSALAKAYHQLGFQTLANQVRQSVQQHDGNAWMFQLDIVKDYPYRINDDLMLPDTVLCEKTPVRMDLSHCCWSDIFFLGMDFPTGAKVLNISVDLAVRGKHTHPSPPIESYLEILHNEPGVLKLTSIDLQCTVTLTHIHEVFEFSADHLGLLRAGVIAAGIVPPGLEGSTASLQELFDLVVGPGKGMHITTKVNDIPKGSRLAVSTNLLGSIIALGMRATRQTSSLRGTLTEEERRLVAARAILGEWLGGSGGGWQDSGGVWPGMKLIQGVEPDEGDVEFGKSRGRLLPVHKQLEASAQLVQTLQDSLVLVHGGMAQNVGPVLEMVTEKYLLREASEWRARQESLEILDQILESFQKCDMKRLAELTTRNFMEPIQSIIPWASNLYTESLIERTREEFGSDFFGFWMLGGCSGGGMGFIFTPTAKKRALSGVMQKIMLSTKRQMECAMPFAMDPVVYDFSINHNGTIADICAESPSLQKAIAEKCELSNASRNTSDNSNRGNYGHDLDRLLVNLGFDQTSHESIREAYKSGTIGLKENRLPTETEIVNVHPTDVIQAEDRTTTDMIALGHEELKKGTVGVVSLAAGVGSRWTQGAGCVKALHPFCKLGDKYRSFLELHLAKSRRMSRLAGTAVPHVITTSHMTNDAILDYLDRTERHGYNGLLYVSQGRSIGVRMIPSERDLRFAFEEKQQQKLDEQAQKVRESGHNALISWAKEIGEGSDYRDNVPLQCLHPVGHYYEIPNLMLNGTLQKMLHDRPQLRYLMLHNIDTVGADVDPGLLGLFASRSSCLAFEVIPREIEDVGGGLARVNGKPRMVEGLALPREDDEFEFTYYNSMTTWIDIDKLLLLYGLNRETVNDSKMVASALNSFAEKLPTYVALKEVKKRWGHGHEDVLPTVQFEKLWSDMTAIDDVECDFVVVPRVRGSQLKDQAQLDGWLRDGSATYLETICEFQS